MGIRRQITWSDKEILLHEIYKKLKRANNVAYKWAQGDFFQQGSKLNQSDSGSSEFDITLASFLQSKLSVGATPSNIFIDNTGTKLFLINYSTDEVKQYTMTTAWDISTLTYVRSFTTTSQETQPIGVWFKSDGTKMWVTGNGSNFIYEYNLSSAWDISAPSLFASHAIETTYISFSEDGLYVLTGSDTSASGVIRELSVAWDLSSSSGSNSGSVYTSSGIGQAMLVNNGLHIVGVQNGDDVFFDKQLTNAYSFTDPIGYDTLDLSGKEGLPKGFFIAPAAGKMYMTGWLSDDIHEYSLNN